MADTPTCGCEQAGRAFAEEQLMELRAALADIGLAWVVGAGPTEAGRLLPLTEAEQVVSKREDLVAEFRTRLGLPRWEPAGPCGLCGRPYSPDHNTVATGQQPAHVFHQFAPRDL